MTPLMLDILEQFRARALERNIPSVDVERWMRLVRPCATLAEGADGPVVGRFGGTALLPADVETPWYPLIAAIDCAALPADVTDVPLPADGRLLLFGHFDTEGTYDSAGDVVYVPAGTAVEQRDEHPASYNADDELDLEFYEMLAPRDLRLRADVSLPSRGYVELLEAPWDEPLPGHPHSRALAETWEGMGGGAPLQLGGYGLDCNGFAPAELAAKNAAEAARAGRRPSPDDDDWVLLAQGSLDAPGGGATIFWSIQRDDLAAQRFDRAHAVADWKP